MGVKMKQLGWFLVIWAASVAVMLGVGAMIRFVLNP